MWFRSLLGWALDMKWLYGSLLVTGCLASAGSAYFVGYDHGFQDSERRTPPIPQLSAEMKEAILHQYQDWQGAQQ